MLHPCSSAMHLTFDFSAMAGNELRFHQFYILPVPKPEEAHRRQEEAGNSRCDRGSSKSHLFPVRQTDIH